MGEELVPGRVVADRYQVEELIGAGGMAEVYRVRHVELGSEHAMKVLAWRRPQLAERFEREARIQATLLHPNIVKVSDLLRFDGQVALVMDYVRGPSLEALLTEHGGLPPQDALDLFVPILAAVAAAHDRQIWHRDLKPANVLLAPTPTGFVPKVTDFGIAKVVQDEMGRGTKTGLAMGTPGYMAPEQVRDSSSVDGRADIFALGAILHEMFTGARAYANADGEVSLTSTVDRDAPPLDVPGVDRRVAEAVHRATARSRDERFPDCRSFAEALGVADDPLFAPIENGRVLFSTAVPVSDGVLATGERVVQPRSGGALSTTPLPASNARRAARVGVALVLASGVGLVALAALALTVFRPDPVTPAPPLPTLVVAPPPAPAPAPLPEAVPVPVPVPVPVSGLADPVSAPPPEPSVEPELVPEPAPAPAPGPELLAVVVPEPARAPTPAPPPAPFDPMTVLAGTWVGDADGRRFELRFTSAREGTVRAEAVFLAGAARTARALVGTFDQASGRLMLRGDDGSTFSGVVAGSAITGEYAARSGAKQLRWSVTR